MAGGVRETKWVVTIDGNAKEASAETVTALKAMAAEYEVNKTALRSLSTALKAQGKGTSEVTTKIKEQIEKLTARQAVLSKDAAKHGQSVATIVRNAKKEAAEREKAAKKIAEAEKARIANQAKAYSMLGGRLGGLRNKLVEYKDVAGESGGKQALFRSALLGAASAATTLAMAAAAAGVAVGVGLTAAIATATVSLTKWVVLTASARQQSQLQLEAWVRTGRNARNLADQIDLLSSRVPTSTEALTQLAIKLRQAGLRGAPLVDSLHAIGQASSALGDSAASKLESFLTRYERMGVVQIPMEMLGSGIDFDDIAGALAKQMGVSIGKARVALATGRVKLADGAKAMRKAIESQVSGINLRKMSDLSKVTERFGGRLASLTKDVDLAPVSRFLDRIYKVLDESTVTGQALKTLFESVAKAFGSSLDANVDWIEYGLSESIIFTNNLAADIIILKNRIEDAFNDGRTAAEKFNSVVDIIKGSLQVIAGIAISPFSSAGAAALSAEGAGNLSRGVASNVVTDEHRGVVSTVRERAGALFGSSLPAHADGGKVTAIEGGIAHTVPLPAAGEGLASIGIGETIVPASSVRSSGSGASISIGDIYVQSSEADPKDVAGEVAESVIDKILSAIELSNAQLGVE